MEITNEQKHALLRLMQMGQMLASVQKELLDLHGLIINNSFELDYGQDAALKHHYEYIRVLQENVNVLVWGCFQENMKPKK